MSKKKKVIAFKNEKTRIPTFHILLTYLLLDKWKAPLWVWGAVGMLYLIVLVVNIMTIANEQDVDIFKEPNSETL